MAYQSLSDIENIVKAAKGKDNLNVCDFDALHKTQPVYSTHRDFMNTEAFSIAL